MTNNTKSHLAYISEIILEKLQTTTMGKKWKGEISIKVNVFEGGITKTECEAYEKIGKKE